MVVETDYQNAHIMVKRGDKVIHTFEYKEFVPGSKIKAINDIKVRIAVIYRKEPSEDVQKELEAIEKEYFDVILSTACNNPLLHSEALEKFTLPEINGISEEAYVFLVTWSSIEGVKAYGLSHPKTQTTKKEPESLTSSQT